MAALLSVSEMKSGSSRRKPSHTRRIVDTAPSSDGEELQSVRSIKEEPIDVIKPSCSEVENNDNDELLSFPEGTVMVVPEPVKAGSSPFKGPELSKLSTKLKEAEHIEKLIVTCTACSTQINHKIPGFAFEHPELGVLLCKKCKNFYNSGSFSKDENGVDEYCRWCAEGGKLICCDFCTNAFCESCIRRNLGRSILSQIVRANVWHCFICDKTPLTELRTLCRLVVQAMTEGKIRHISKPYRVPFASPSSKVDPKTGVEMCLENSVLVCRNLRNEAQGLHRKLLTSKSDPSVIVPRIGAKLKDVISYTQKSLENIYRAIDRELEKSFSVGNGLEPSTSKASILGTSSKLRDMDCDASSVKPVMKPGKPSKRLRYDVAKEGSASEAQYFNGFASSCSDVEGPQQQQHGQNRKADRKQLQKSVKNEESGAENKLEEDFVGVHLNRDPLLSSTPKWKSVGYDDTEATADGEEKEEGEDAKAPGILDILVKDDGEVIGEFKVEMSNDLKDDDVDCLQTTVDDIELSVVSVSTDGTGYGDISEGAESHPANVLSGEHVEAGVAKEAAVSPAQSAANHGQDKPTNDKNVSASPICTKSGKHQTKDSKRQLQTSDKEISDALDVSIKSKRHSKLNEKQENSQNAGNRRTNKEHESKSDDGQVEKELESPSTSLEDLFQGHDPTADSDTRVSLGHDPQNDSEEGIRKPRKDEKGHGDADSISGKEVLDAPELAESTMDGKDSDVLETGNTKRSLKLLKKDVDQVLKGEGQTFNEGDGGSGSYQESSTMLYDPANYEERQVVQNDVEINKNELAKKQLLSTLLDDDSDQQISDVGQSDAMKQTLKAKSESSPRLQVTRTEASPLQRPRIKTTPRKQTLERSREHCRDVLTSSLDSSLTSSDDDIPSRNKQEVSITDDAKLNVKAVVVLRRLNSSIMKELRQTGRYMIPRRLKRKLSDSGSAAESRAVNKLCDFKSLRLKKKKAVVRNSSTDNSDDNWQDPFGGKVSKNSSSQEKRHRKSKGKAIDDILSLLRTPSNTASSGNSKSEKSSDEEFRPKLREDEDTTKFDKNARAKAMLSELLTNSGDDDEDDLKEKQNSDSSHSFGKKKGRERKTSKGMDDDSDDSDFQPPLRRKGRKFSSALLRAPLGESDSDSSVAMISKKSTSKRKSTCHSDSSVEIKNLSSSSSSCGLKIKSKKTRGRKLARDDTSDDSARHGKKRVKRRRIKAMTDSSDSDVQVVNEKSGQDSTPTGKGGRKNIRKLIKDYRLRDDTKFAAKEEDERRRRVIELQALYNEVVEKAEGIPVTKKLALSKDLGTGDPIVEVSPDLIEKLKPHQVEGVKFLWECTCESLERLKNTSGSGCIIAHCMGLGKTLQVITFLHTVLTARATKLKTALVVCPLNTVINWYSEFIMWLDDVTPPLMVMEMSSVKSNYERARVLKNWLKGGGVVIMGYDMFRILVQEKAKRVPKSCRETFQKTLIDPGPDLVVCDEGHILKNCNTAVSKAMTRIRSRRRIVLTGTPLQNNLSEYHCMVDFVKPNLLGTIKEFQNRFVNPIQNGQCADSTAGDVRLMKRRAHILHDVLDGCVQRRDYSVLTPFLPPKHEFVISVKLSKPQVDIYRYYLDNYSRRAGKNSLFSDYQALMRIWTHPYLIRMAEIREENKVKYDSEESFINDNTSDSNASDGSIEVLCDDDDDDAKNKPGTSKGKRRDGSSDDEVVNTWKSRSRGGKGAVQKEAPVVEEEPASTVSHWWTEFLSEDIKQISLSGKFVIIFDILKECYAIGDKVLLFSQSLLTLDLLEDLLRESMTEVDGKLPDHYCGNWIHGIDFFRLDGSTSADLRSKYVRIFNDKDNLMARLFLISTRAGSLGINLVAANRVVMMDASWNPTHDVQSIFRVYRFGQEKPVYIYRLLSQGTMEEKIYDRQVTKQSLACRVVDEQQIERHFSFADLQELYTLNLDTVNKRPTPMVPKDRLLAELLIRHKDTIIAYHEHDSLLENQAQEELTEDERSAAWVEYEAEKQGILQEFSAQSMGLPGFSTKHDIHKIIQDIQEKHPGLSKMELKAKFHETIALLNSARQQALEKRRQEVLQRQQLAYLNSNPQQGSMPGAVRAPMVYSYSPIHGLHQAPGNLQMPLAPPGLQNMSQMRPSLLPSLLTNSQPYTAPPYPVASYTAKDLSTVVSAAQQVSSNQTNIPLSEID